MATNARQDPPSWFARERAEAYRIGFLEGRGQALIQILELRGIVFRAADRHFILGCGSIDTLDRWSDRAWQVSKISDLFDDWHLPVISVPGRATLTTTFVLVVLSLTREEASVAVSGMGIGITFALVNLVGIPFDGASVNPARSFGPAVVAGGSALSQVWVFFLGPLLGAVFATIFHYALYPLETSTRIPGMHGKHDTAQPAADSAPETKAPQEPGSMAG